MAKPNTKASATRKKHVIAGCRNMGTAKGRRNRLEKDADGASGEHRIKAQSRNKHLLDDSGTEQYNIADNMNATTEKQGAAAALDLYAVAPVNGVDRRLLWIAETPNWTERLGVRIQEVERPKAWRLVCDALDGGLEEVILSVVGSIVSHDLPPVVKKQTQETRKHRYIRQSIGISGLGTATFDAALRSTAEIYGLFDRQFSVGALESFATANSNRSGEDTLDASNRYFTSARDASPDEIVPFGKDVDPKGILQAMTGDGLEHTEDNEVLYFFRRMHEPIGPQAFRIGDIVEIQVSFIVVPLKGERFKMMTVLRSIALIDGTFSKKIVKKEEPTTARPITLKRKIMYDDPEYDEDGPRASKKGMEVEASDVN